MHVRIVAVRLCDARVRRGPHARRVRVCLALIGMRAHALEPTCIVRCGDARASIVGVCAVRRRIALAEGHAPTLLRCVGTRGCTVRKVGVRGIVVDAMLGVVEERRKRLIPVFIHVSRVVRTTSTVGGACGDTLVGALVLDDPAHKVARFYALTRTHPQVANRRRSSRDAQCARRARREVGANARNRG